MKTDGYGLFTECHRLYIAGVRAAVRECLEFRYGDNWWKDGVLAAISPEQRQQFERIMQRDAPTQVEELLDAPHFGSIICRSDSFADRFNDLSATYRKLRHLGYMRNAWAHMRMRTISLARVMQSLDIMEDILASLRRREALEVARMRDEFSAHTSVERNGFEDLLEEEDVDGVEELANENPSERIPAESLAMWSHLQSYLQLDILVEPSEEDESLASVVLRVSNRAPSGTRLPDIHFRDVRVDVIPEGRYYFGRLQGVNLAPGQTAQEDLTVPLRQLAHTEFDLRGSVDWDQLFSFRRKSGPPKDAVRRILDEFVERFQSLGIREFLQEILDEITAAEPTMTMQQAAQLRARLGDFQSVAAEKTEGMNGLYEEFMLNNETTIGAQCVEVVAFLKGLTGNIHSLDQAIGQTDLESISQAVNDLEQSQLAIIRLENTIREIAERAA